MVISLTVPLTITAFEAIPDCEILASVFKLGVPLGLVAESDLTVEVAVSEGATEERVISVQNVNHRSSFDEEVPARSIPEVLDELIGQLMF